MRGRIFQAATLLIYGAVLLALVAAAPHQGIPPSPVIFTGTATADGQPAPEGTLLVACVDNLVCAPDHSDPDFLRDGDTVGAGGRFVALIAQGVTESQRGRATVHFFLINEHGRIKAQETATYGSSSATELIFTQDLTFGVAPTPVPTATPTPAPTPTPTPTPPPRQRQRQHHPRRPQQPLPPIPPSPSPASPLVPQLANVVLYGGIALLIVGAAGLLYARRRPLLSPVEGPSTTDPPQTQPATQKGRAPNSPPLHLPPCQTPIDPHAKHPLTPTPRPLTINREQAGDRPLRVTPAFLIQPLTEPPAPSPSQAQRSGVESPAPKPNEVKSKNQS